MIFLYLGFFTSSGTPASNASEGTSLVNTEPVAITEKSPIVEQGNKDVLFLPFNVKHPKLPIAVVQTPFQDSNITLFTFENALSDVNSLYYSLQFLHTNHRDWGNTKKRKSAISSSVENTP